MTGRLLGRAGGAAAAPPPAPAPHGAPPVTSRRGGGVAARIAVARWAWRLFRREWRQQVLVIALLTVSVAAAVAGATAAYNASPDRDGDFGSAEVVIVLDRTDPQAADADVATIEATYGPVEIIGHRDWRVPGLARAADLRSQATDGIYSRPMLALRTGRYPTAPGEIALTRDLASTLGTRVGATVNVEGAERAVVGLVENPADLDDQFALEAPATADQASGYVVLARDNPAIRSFPDLPTQRRSMFRNQSDRTTAALGVFAVVALSMLLVALVAAAGFVVLAHRRLRQLGLMAAVGATRRQLRAAVVANGLVVGAVSGVIGVGLALAVWLTFASRLEPAANHRIDRFDIPWGLVAAGVALAVLTSMLAAWWPARTVASVPVTAALSGRPPAPKPVRRPVLLALVLVVGGLAALDAGNDVAKDTGNLPLFLGGMVTLVVGVLLLAPVVVRSLGWVGARSPIAVRLALRDLARNPARAGTALASISLALGVAAAVVLIAGAAQSPADKGNLPANQILLRHRTDPDADRKATDRARDDAAAAAIAESLGATSTVPLDIAIDSRKADDDLTGVGIAVRIGPSLRRFAGVPVVLTPEVAERYGIDTAGLDPGTELVTSERGDIAFVGLGAKLPPISGVVAIEALPYSSGPTSFIPPEAVRRHGWATARASWLLEFDRPLTGAQLAAARDAAVAADLVVETRDSQEVLSTIRRVATATGFGLALAILAMTVGLLRAEAADDLRTLTATGAPRGTRRIVTASTAGALALLGALIGTGGASLAVAAGYAEDLSRLRNVPVLYLLVLTVGVPVAAAAAGWLAGGRQPDPYGAGVLDVAAAVPAG